MLRAACGTPVMLLTRRGSGFGTQLPPEIGSLAKTFLLAPSPRASWDKSQKLEKLTARSQNDSKSPFKLILNTYSKLIPTTYLTLTPTHAQNLILNICPTLILNTYSKLILTTCLKLNLLNIFSKLRRSPYMHHMKHILI